jgi:hypothetical protein
MQALLRQFSSVKLFAAAIALVLLSGYGAPLERYITPARGWGYTLGIIGGSMMLLLIYPARKRVAWLGLYTRIRARLDGGQTNRGELRRIAHQLPVQSTSVHGRELCQAPARCQSPGRGVSAVRAAVFPVACTARAAVHHVVDRGRRARDLVRGY